MIVRLSRRLALAGLFVIAGLFRLATPVSAQESDRRPDLPDEETYGTEHFLIHYTFTGDDAAPGEDTNGDGIPDYLKTVGDTLEYVWSVEINDLGWTAPPFDEGEEGDTRLDVYLVNILKDNYAGYILDDGFVGDNPNSVEQERRAAYGFMVLDNDYAETESLFGVGTEPLDLMRSTVAHEFNHLIQIGYDSFDQHFWLYESTASWIEDEIYDDVNDNVFYIYDLFDEPGRCFVSEENWYANWLFLRLISEQYGAETVRSIWESNRTMDGFDAIDAALAPYGSSLENEASKYVIANLLRDYEEGDTYPTPSIEASIENESYSKSGGIQSFGANYIRVRGNGTVDVTLEAEFSLLTLRVAGIRAESADVLEAVGNVVTVNLDDYDFVVAVVQNMERITPDQNCTFAEYTITAAPSGSAPHVASETTTADKAEEPGTEVGGGGPGNLPQVPVTIDLPFLNEEDVPEPDALDVPFVYIIPATAPPGYGFDFAYILGPDDFGEAADFYIPGGGDSANLDYLSDNGDWIGVTQSVSPYQTLDEWMEDIGYFDSPGSIEIEQGVEVLVEDFSDDEGPWYSATLIINGLFIVVDSDGARDDARAMASILIQEVLGSGGVEQPPTAVAEEPEVFHPQTDNEPDAIPVEDDLASLLMGTGMLLACGGGLCLALALGAVILGVLFLRKRRR